MISVPLTELPRTLCRREVPYADVEIIYSRDVINIINVRPIYFTLSSASSTSDLHRVTIFRKNYQHATPMMNSPEEVPDKLADTNKPKHDNK